MESLLTDPQIVNDDYLFWGKNPSSAQSKWKDIGKIGDIKTGKAYVELYAKLIKNLASRCYSP
jgi:hypothetical protein